MRSKLLCSLILIGSAVSAQDRARLRGVALRAGGEPWATATVTLYGRPVRGMEAFGDADELEVQTDARGRFAAEVVRGRPYLVWAHQSDDDGTYRASRPRLGVSEGGTVRLRESSAPRVAPTVTLRVDAAWKRPLTVQLTSAQNLREAILNGAAPRFSVPFVIPVQLREDESFAFPELPWSDCSVELYDATGLQLVTFRVDLDASTREAQLKGKPEKKQAAGFAAMPVEMMKSARGKTVAIDRTEFTVPAGDTVKLRARIEKRSGEPVGRFDVVQRVRGRTLRIATTDADGVASLRLPFGLPKLPFAYPFSATSAHLIVRARGYGEVDAKNSESEDVDHPFQGAADTDAKDKRAAEPVAVVKAGTFLAGRLLCKGKPIASSDLLVEISRGRDPVAGMPRRRRELVRTGKDGRFRLRNVNAGLDYRVFAVLDDAALEACTTDSGRPFRHALVAVGKTAADKPRLGDIELTELRRLKLAVRNPDGSPARDASIGVVSTESKPGTPLVLFQPNCDRRGETVWIGASFDDMTVSAVTDDAWGFVALGEATKGKNEVVLALKAPVVLAGVVKTPDGKPASHVMIQAQPSGDSDSFNNVATFIERFFGRSDAKGRFEFWLPGHAESVSVTMVRSRNNRILGFGSQQITVENGAARDLELQMPDRPGFPGVAAPAKVRRAVRKDGKPVQRGEAKKPKREKKRKRP